MKVTIAGLLAVLVLPAGVIPVLAADLKDKVKVEVESVGLHPGMEPGTYVCALGHLHIKGTVQNLADVPLGRVKVAGKAFDAQGTLLGTATASTGQAVLKPNETAEIDLEFLTVTGPMIKRVKKHEIAVIEALRKP